MGSSCAHVEAERRALKRRRFYLHKEQNSKALPLEDIVLDQCAVSMAGAQKIGAARRAIRLSSRNLQFINGTMT